MQDGYLCFPPYFFLGPAVAPHFFHSRIATVGPNCINPDLITLTTLKEY